MKKTKGLTKAERKAANILKSKQVRRKKQQKRQAKNVKEGKVGTRSSYSLATWKVKEMGYMDFSIGSEACILRDEIAQELREEWGGERYVILTKKPSPPEEPKKPEVQKGKKQLKREQRLREQEGEPVEKWYKQGANVHAPFSKYIW